MVKICLQFWPPEVLEMTLNPEYNPEIIIIKEGAVGGFIHVPSGPTDSKVTKSTPNDPVIQNLHKNPQSAELPKCKSTSNYSTNGIFG